MQLFPHVTYLNNNIVHSLSTAATGEEGEADSNTDESEWDSSVATSDLDSSTSDSDCDLHDFENIPAHLPEFARFVTMS